MNKRITLLLLVSALIMGACTNPTPKDFKVLVYTKNGTGYIHDNVNASIKAIKKLGAANSFIVDSSADPRDINESNLKQYACIILSNTNNETFDTEEQKLAFVRYLHAGGGVVGIHSACGSERDWPWFWAMLGGKFERHPPMQSFDIKVIRHDHPSTEFLGDTWQWTDEFYYLKHLNLDLTYLLAGKLSTLEDEKLSEYPGEVFGNYFPLAWYHEFEGSRVFYTALGHNIEFYEDENFTRHILGGILWSVGNASGPDYSNVNTSVVPKN